MPITDMTTGLLVGDRVDERPAERPDPVVLDGRTVTLRPIEPAEDAEPLFRASHGEGKEKLWLYLFPAPFPDVRSFRAWLEACSASRDPLFSVVVDRSTGLASGMVSLMRIVPEHRVIEVGNIWFSPTIQGGVRTTEAIYLLARHAFETLRFRRFEWKCNALNEPSKRAAVRLGFTPEGIFRSHMIVKGRSRDTAWFSMLDREWPQRRHAFERWLDPANFDEAGRQRFALSTLNRSRANVDGLDLRRADLGDRKTMGAIVAAAMDAAAAEGRAPPPGLASLDETGSQGREVWLAETDGALLGLVGLWPMDGAMEVCGPAVAPPARGRGIGLRLLKFAERRACELGFARLRAAAAAPTAPGLTWCEKRGYVPTDPDAGDGLVRLEKALA